MRVVSHISTARTKVREGELSRHLGARLDGGKAFVVTTGLGLPRTWWLANQALARGFELGFKDAPPGKKKGDRLIAAADRARRELADVCDHLVEHALPDAAFATGAHTARKPHRCTGWRSRIRIRHTARPVRHQWPTPKAKDESMPATAAAAVTVAPETLTITWLVAGGIIAELLILIVFLVRVAWWLSQRFTLIDATLAANAKEITAIKMDVSNDIAGRKVVAEARTDIAQIKATLGEFRERIDRIEANEDGRKHA